MKKHANIAIFVPNSGCPHRCSFCDQQYISGKNMQPSPDMAARIVYDAAQSLKDKHKPAQIAFFGGSFTALDKSYMISLLQSVQKYIDGEICNGIRISTRPDAIDKITLETLKKYRVTDIELGAQSMDDTVLKANLRGHTPQDVCDAVKMIKQHGFRTGLQMMTGLYKDTPETTYYTANTIASLRPDSVRIYPTVVLKGTKLHVLFLRDEYKPQTLDSAVELCADILELFISARIPVIKLGLHDGADLKDNIVAGPYYPAFRELCESQVLLKKVICQLCEEKIPRGGVLIRVNAAAISKMVGQKRENMLKLKRLGYEVRIIPDDSLGYLEVEISDQKGGETVAPEITGNTGIQIIPGQNAP